MIKPSPIPSHNAIAGIALIEQLLCITIIGLIIIFSLHHYFLYHKKLQPEEIKSDIDHIFFALNNYFNSHPCDANGIFNGKSQPDLINDLHLSFLAMGRRPLINNYEAKITQLKIKNQEGKFLYQFVITGKTLFLSSFQLHHLSNATNAYYYDDTQQKIQWKTLPIQNYQKNPLYKMMTYRLQQLKY